MPVDLNERAHEVRQQLEADDNAAERWGDDATGEGGQYDDDERKSPGDDSESEAQDWSYDDSPHRALLRAVLRGPTLSMEALNRPRDRSRVERFASRASHEPDRDDAAHRRSAADPQPGTRQPGTGNAEDGCVEDCLRRGASPNATDCGLGGGKFVLTLAVMRGSVRLTNAFAEVARVQPRKRRP